MLLWKRINALLVVVLGVVACSDPPVAPVPAGKALGQAEADSTQSDAATDSPAPAVVSFADANLERVVRRTLNKPEGRLTTDDLASLTKLDVEWQDVSGIESLAGLEHATALDTLNLWGNQIVDLSPLAGLTQLTHLNLGHNQVVDVGALAGLTNLKWLSLWGNEVADLSALAGLTKLTYLNLWGNQIEAVSALAGLTKLTSLDLGHNAVADVRPLDGLTRLDWLGLVDNLIRQPDLAEQVPTLIEQDVNISVVLPNPQPPPAPAPPPTPAPPPAPVVVSFADANLEGAVRQALDKPEGELTSADLASLTRLDADDLNIESLAGLEHATALSYLALIGNPISDVSPLASLTKLEELDLNGTSIGDAGVASLSSLTNLTFLDLGGTSIGDAGVAELTSLTKLEELNLHSTSIGDAGVASLSSLTKLEDLGLSNTSITDVSPLLSLTNLQWLWLRRVTTLSAASINTHIPALEAAGVTVTR